MDEPQAPWGERRKKALGETVLLLELPEHRSPLPPWLPPILRDGIHRLTDRVTRVVFGRGLDTSGTTIDLAHFHSERAHYEPSGWWYLRRALADIEMSRDEVFVDFGSGKGRIVYQAAQYPIKRVIGVEISEKLSKVARANVDRNWHRLRCENVELVTCDAADFEIPDDMTIGYFYYPFVGETFRRVIDNIVASLDRNQRPIRLIYACPYLANEILATERFRVERHLRGGRTDYLPQQITIFVSNEPGPT